MNIGSLAAPLFSAAWQTKYAAQAERGMIGEIAVYTVADKVYDVDTDTWTQTTTTILLDKARVQPLRSANDIDVPGNATTVQSVLVSVPVANNDVALYPGQLVAVLVSPLNPQLLTLEYIVSDIVDSTNPLERTFYVTVNQEKVV